MNFFFETIGDTVQKHEQEKLILTVLSIVLMVVSFMGEVFGAVFSGIAWAGGTPSASYWRSGQGGLHGLRHHQGSCTCALRHSGYAGRPDGVAI